MGHENRLITFILILFVSVSLYAGYIHDLNVKYVNRHDKDSIKMDSFRLELNTIMMDTSRVYQIDGFKRTQFNIWFRNTYPNYSGK